MIPYLGDFAEDSSVYIPFNTFSSDDPSASATITDLADADIMVHKDGGLTQIATDGATVAIDFDGITGNHLITVDTSVDATYSTGSDYTVRIEGTTVDGATINAWVGSFSIENRYSSAPTAVAVRTEIDSNSTQLAAIKAKTDDLTFTKANELDANPLSLNGSAASAANLALSSAGIIPGATSGTPTTTASDTNLSGYADDELISRIVVFTGGVANGQATTITDYASTNGVITYDLLTTAPAAADTFVIL